VTESPNTVSGKQKEVPVSGNPSTVSTGASAPAEPVQPRRNEWLLIAFAGTTNTADAAMKVALPLLATTLTDSPALIAAVLIALTLPWLLTALHIGVMVDRMNRRTLMVAAELARMTSITVVLLAVALHFVSLPLIFAVAAVLGVAEVTAQLANASIVPSAAPKSRWQKLNTRITAVEYVSYSFLGSPIGGLLVAAGFVIALSATGAVYLVGALLLVGLAGNFAVKQTKERRPARVEIKEGLQFLWRHKLLRTMSALVMVLAGSWSAWYALLPAYAVTGPLGLSPGLYGVLLTCLGAGGVLGTVLVGPMIKLVGRRWTMFVNIIGTLLMVGMPAVVPATPSSAWLVGFAAFVAGVGGTMWTVNSRMISQSLVPNEMLGRYSAASRQMAWGINPLAAGLAGVLAQVFGFKVAFGFFAVAALLLIYPFLRVITPETVAEVDAPAKDDGTPAEKTATAEETTPVEEIVPVETPVVSGKS
jgi:MFS family permease